ncbi:hypothetical protein ALC60_02671 [Trachymyrmex zeteki]|uniref:Uncharacterized protein n=1 Tax=Mycetomoellerius zeteki TaxID=64791 RepID=A0A151XD02_9HYME|nr:hypothetical protein ALC60_02671 [Trachymyrmex zeteki]
MKYFVYCIFYIRLNDRQAQNISKKSFAHGTHTCRVCTIGFVDLIRTWHGISSCYYLERETVMINAMIVDCLQMELLFDIVHSAKRMT